MSYIRCLTRGGGGTKTAYHRHNGVFVGRVNSFLVSILFFLAEYFATFYGMSEVSVGDFLCTSAPSALQLRSPRSFRKKLQNISQKEQNITKNGFIIQRKHRYPYNKYEKNWIFLVEEGMPSSSKKLAIFFSVDNSVTEIKVSRKCILGQRIFFLISAGPGDSYGE